jgi:hypothetical protein
MEILNDQRWLLHSEAEARFVGRAAALTLNDGTETYILKHPGTEHPARNESEFFAREMQYGELAVSRTIAHQAELGFQQIQESDVATHGITQAIADVFVEKIQAQRLDNARQQITELPVSGHSEVRATLRGDNGSTNPHGESPLAA